MRSIKEYLFGLMVFLVVGSCEKPELARVGSVRITEKDLKYRAKVSEIYYPESGKEYVALAQLIQGYLNEEVLKQLGEKVDEEVWKAEATRIERDTKAPEMLKKIKAVYGRDQSSYLKTFVRVVYAERYLYNEVFLKSKEIHQEQQKKASAFLKQAQQEPDSFGLLAQKQGLRSLTFLVSEDAGIQPYPEERKKLEPSGMPKRHTGMEQAQFVIEKVKALSPGEVFPEVIEWQEGFQVLRFLKREGENYLIEAVNIPKLNYEDWFWSYASKIPVRVNDPVLKEELLKQVAWATKLKWE